MSVCPGCGRCSQCGQPRLHPLPYYPVWVYPPNYWWYNNRPTCTGVGTAATSGTWSISTTDGTQGQVSA